MGALCKPSYTRSGEKSKSSAVVLDSGSSSQVRRGTDAYLGKDGLTVGEIELSEKVILSFRPRCTLPRIGHGLVYRVKGANARRRKGEYVVGYGVSPDIDARSVLTGMADT